MLGDRRSSHASATCIGVAPRPAATALALPDEAMSALDRIGAA
jgi:hypothetical protein